MLPFRTATAVTDSSCKSSSITSSGDPPLITSSDSGRPQVPPPPTHTPLYESHLQADKVFPFLGISPKVPNCHRAHHPSTSTQLFLFFFSSRSAHLFVRLHRRVQRADASCVGRRGSHIFADRTCGSVSKYSGAEGETLNICHGDVTEKVPKQGTWAQLRSSRKCTVSSARCSSLTFCLSLTRMSSHLLPSIPAPPTLPAPS